MSDAKVILEEKVRPEWVDYNGHMNDAEYVRVFSWGVDRFMKMIGITDDFREENRYTIYTMETHVCYLNELKLDEPLEVQLQMLDYDAKRAHVFFELYGPDGRRAATSEQMLMGIDQTTGRPSPFPDEIFTQVEDLAKACMPDEKPAEAGRVIGIRRKK
ncbi:thioesterase family protein [Virgibacillus sediminis]|uniref:Thioesterase family protein n=1 Tax=Virgibacillus sediminis TaxID=202260 RepID=A0ABV7A7G0_9BACI